MLKDGREQLSHLFQDLGVPPTTDLHCEYRVPARRGRGLPSQTDLMVLAGDSSWAIEAKWTEPRYETVADRLVGDADESNRTEVLRGWLEMIQPFASIPLHISRVRPAVYQMIHRTASACAIGVRPALVYLLFHTPDSIAKGFYREDLALLHELLGRPTGLAFYQVAVKIAPTAAFDAIRSLRRGKPGTGRRVKHALLTEKLFEVSAPIVERIHG